MPSARLTAVIIARDEQDNLAELIPALKTFVEDVLVVDGGSRDATCETARRLGARVLVAADWQGYGIQRRRGEEAVDGGWIFMIDADERVPPELAREIREAIATVREPTVFALARLSWVFGRFLRHGGWFPDVVERIYLKGTARYDGKSVHERLVPSPGVAVRRLRHPLLHYTYRDLEHYLVKSARYAALAGAERSARGKRGSLAGATLHGFWCFFRMYLIKKGFLDGSQGFLIAVLSAHSVFCKHADLWVRRQPAPPSPPGSSEDSASP